MHQAGQGFHCSLQPTGEPTASELLGEQGGLSTLFCPFILSGCSSCLRHSVHRSLGDGGVSFLHILSQVAPVPCCICHIGCSELHLLETSPEKCAWVSFILSSQSDAAGGMSRVDTSIMQFSVDSSRGANWTAAAHLPITSDVGRLGTLHQWRCWTCRSDVRIWNGCPLWFPAGFHVHFDIMRPPNCILQHPRKGPRAISTLNPY